MGDENEHENNEHSPLLSNERSVVTPNYEGLGSQGTETVISDEPEEYVSHEEEHHVVPQMQQTISHAGESGVASRQIGPTVACRVCSATIVIESKVKKLALFPDFLLLIKILY